MDDDLSRAHEPVEAALNALIGKEHDAPSSELPGITSKAPASVRGLSSRLVR